MAHRPGRFDLSTATVYLPTARGASRGLGKFLSPSQWHTYLSDSGRKDQIKKKFQPGGTSGLAGIG
jgi:hypothetical protein